MKLILRILEKNEESLSLSEFVNSAHKRSQSVECIQTFALAEVIKRNLKPKVEIRFIKNEIFDSQPLN
jgi:hypothetical protein